MRFIKELCIISLIIIAFYLGVSYSTSTVLIKRILEYSFLIFFVTGVIPYLYSAHTSDDYLVLMGLVSVLSSIALFFQILVPLTKFILATALVLTWVLFTFMDAQRAIDSGMAKSVILACFITGNGIAMCVCHYLEPLIIQYVNMGVIFFPVSMLCCKIICIGVEQYRLFGSLRQNSINDYDMYRYNLSEELNGSIIKDRVYSNLIIANNVIEEWYQSSSGHGYIVCRGSTGPSFICHLIGRPDHLVVEITSTSWQPEGESINTSDKSFMQLMDFIRNYHFGCYSLDVNDCRTFSSEIANFLLINKK